MVLSSDPVFTCPSQGSPCRPWPDWESSACSPPTQAAGKPTRSLPSVPFPWFVGELERGRFQLLESDMDMLCCLFLLEHGQTPSQLSVMLRGATRIPKTDTPGKGEPQNGGYCPSSTPTPSTLPDQVALTPARVFRGWCIRTVSNEILLSAPPCCVSPARHTTTVGDPGASPEHTDADERRMPAHAVWWVASGGFLPVSLHRLGSARNTSPGR